MESLENSLSELTTASSSTEENALIVNTDEEVSISENVDASERFDGQSDENEYTLSPETKDITPDQSGSLMKQILTEGEGDEYPGFGDRVSVYYSGFLLTKEKIVEFESNKDGDLCEFNIGRGVVIKGWDIGLATMKKGEVALFIIQPEYAYGPMGKPPTIPAHTPLLFEVKMVDWKLEDLTPKKDGSVTRKIIEKGEGTAFPNEGALVKVRMVGHYNDTVFEDTEKEFLLGEGVSANVLEAVELALFKFQLNEKSILYLKGKSLVDKVAETLGIPKDSEVRYEITLLSFEKAKDVWEMNTDEKLERAIEAKEKGISYIKSGHFKAALRQFKWILSCLENEPGAPPESKEQRKSLLLSGYLNISLCLLKIENCIDAVKFCTLALKIDPENEKALFRRGQAKMLINDCEEALQDFQTLSEKYPENKVAKQYIIQCQEKIKKQKMKDKSIYNKMFEKFIKQDEERMKSLKTETGVWESDGKEEVVETSEAQRIIDQNDSVLRDANIIELSNTAY